MAKGKKVKEEAVIEDNYVEAEEVKASKKSKKTEVTVKFDGTSRVYSLKVHGEDFEALAEEFATKRNGKIVA